MWQKQSIQGLVHSIGKNTTPFTVLWSKLLILFLYRAIKFRFSRYNLFTFISQQSAMTFLFFWINVGKMYFRTMVSGNCSSSFKWKIKISFGVRWINYNEVDIYYGLDTYWVNQEKEITLQNRMKNERMLQLDLKM